MVRLSEHGVLHYVVPVLTSADSDQDEHAHAEVVEVVVVIYDLPLGDRLEQEGCEDREYEVDEHEECEDVEEGWQRELDGLDQSLQALVLI